MIRIGETTGRLHDALAFLTDYYARKVEQKRIIVNALSYPMITLCIAAVVLVFMLMVVVPMFRQVYSRMGGELPALTEAMIRISEAMPSILAVFQYRRQWNLMKSSSTEPWLAMFSVA